MKQSCSLFVVLCCVLAIAGCGQSDASGNGANENPTPTLSSGSSQASVEGKGPIEALALANKWMGNGVTTYVTPQSISFEFPSGSKTTVGLPADKMVVAIAPYIDNTHTCEIHYMSGCQGELVGVPIDVVARLADGTEILNERLLTMTNGFIELWLPRDHEVSLILEAKGKSVAGTIGTFADSNTCITTLRLM